VKQNNNHHPPPPPIDLAPLVLDPAFGLSKESCYVPSFFSLSRIALPVQLGIFRGAHRYTGTVPSSLSTVHISGSGIPRYKRSDGGVGGEVGRLLVAEFVASLLYVPVRVQGRDSHIQYAVCLNIAGHYHLQIPISSRRPC
jgi:hypothetical protein